MVINFPRTKLIHSSDSSNRDFFQVTPLEKMKLVMTDVISNVCFANCQKGTAFIILW